jgi:hypothetical protein
MNDLEWDLGIQLPYATVPVVVCGGTSGALAAKNQFLRRSFVFFLSIEEYPNHNQGDLISERCRRESGIFLKEVSFGDFLTRIESWVGERER